MCRIYKSLKLLRLVVSFHHRLPADRAIVVTSFDPLLYARSMEEVPIITRKSCYHIFWLVWGHANNTFVFTRNGPEKGLRKLNPWQRIQNQSWVIYTIPPIAPSTYEHKWHNYENVSKKYEVEVPHNQKHEHTQQKWVVIFVHTFLPFIIIVIFFPPPLVINEIAVKLPS